MIKREHYIAQIRPFYESDLIKIISGVRRAGKSVVLTQIFDEIKNKTDNAFYLNFEDQRIYSKFDSYEKLVNYIIDNKRDGKAYVFLDEIQNLDNWALAVKTLRINDCSLFITGSNSRMLSSEFTKELSGRYVSFRIRTFVYKEILEYQKELGKQISENDYIIWGGFPKRLEFDANESRKYLSELTENIVVRDIVQRKRIKNVSLFKRLVNYILVSNARIFSVNSICKFIKNEYKTCSVNTVMNYLLYLKEAYIINSIEQYSTKTKTTLKFYEKMYDEDVAFNSLFVENNRFDITHNFENIVYNELLYMGYELKVFLINNKEIDFYATKNNKHYYIQVAYSLVDNKAYEREFEPFKTLNNLNQKIIISNDEIDYSTSSIRHIKFSDFLRMEDLDKSLDRI